MFAAWWEAPECLDDPCPDEFGLRTCRELGEKSHYGKKIQGLADLSLCSNWVLCADGYLRSEGELCPVEERDILFVELLCRLSDSMDYSAAKQIDKSNVDQLKLAWFVPAPGPAGRFSFNPLVIGEVMYVVGKDNGVYALDAATGKQIWAHPVEGGQPTNRGFNHWASKDGKDQRLMFAVDGYLQEIDMKTGETIRSFGQNGRVDLRKDSDATQLVSPKCKAERPDGCFRSAYPRLGSGRGLRFASWRYSRL